MRLGLSDGLRDGWAASGTVAELVRERTDGALPMLHVLTYVGLWGRFTEANGRHPRSVLELSKAMKVSQKTLWRWERRFAESFPELDSPAPLWERVRARVSADVDLDPDVLAVQVGAVQL
jgi:hypothetical protein